MRYHKPSRGTIVSRCCPMPFCGAFLHHYPCQVFLCMARPMYCSFAVFALYWLLWELRYADCVTWSASCTSCIVSVDRIDSGRQEDRLLIACGARLHVNRDRSFIMPLNFDTHSITDSEVNDFVALVAEFVAPLKSIVAYRLCSYLKYQIVMEITGSISNVWNSEPISWIASISIVWECVMCPIEIFLALMPNMEGLR